MKALTVRPPWPWAIAAGEKLIENRGPGALRWRPQHDLVIHAGASWSYRGGGDDRVREAWARHHDVGLVGKLTPESAGMVRSAFVCVVDLVDVHPGSGCCEPWGEREYQLADGTQMKRITHLVLDNVRPLSPPVRWRRGWLGLWTIPKDGEVDVRRALA